MNHSPPFFCETAVLDCPTRTKPVTILTIDDDLEITQAIQRCFRRYNVTVLQAHHGMQGVWIASTKTPDVIITDLRMPQGHGQHVVAYLKSNSKTCNIPIIVLTGLHNDQLEQYMRELGVHEYLNKPVAFEELYEAVNRIAAVEERTEDD